MLYFQHQIRTDAHIAGIGRNLLRLYRRQPVGAAAVPIGKSLLVRHVIDRGTQIFELRIEFIFQAVQPLTHVVIELFEQFLVSGIQLFQLLFQGIVSGKLFIAQRFREFIDFPLQIGNLLLQLRIRRPGFVFQLFQQFLEFLLGLRQFLLKLLDLQIRLMQKGYYIDANGTVAFNYEEDK